MSARRTYNILAIAFLLGGPWLTQPAQTQQNRPWTNDAVRFRAKAVTGSGEAPQSDLSSACRGRLTGVIGRSSSSAVQGGIVARQLQVAHEGLSVAFQAGQHADKGQLLGGTELTRLVSYDGKLYAGTGYWEDSSGSDPSPGPAILVLDSPRAHWRLEHVFSERRPDGRERFLAVSVVKVITFTTDDRGRVIPPVPIFVAGLQAAAGGVGAIFSRDNSRGEWIESLSRGKGIRAVGFYKDPVTGVDRIFAGVTGYSKGDQSGAIISGVYDPSVPGRIRWDQKPEFTDFRNRVMGFVECNRGLYFAAKPSLFQRALNGNSPKWKEVCSYSPELARTNSGLRGLTAISDPHAPGHDLILAALEGDHKNHARIVAIDPLHHHSMRSELDIVNFLIAQWGRLIHPSVIAAYNDMPLVESPLTKESVRLIGLQAHCPLPGKQRSAWYLVRDSGAHYSLHEVPPISFSPESRESPHTYLSLMRSSGRQSVETGPALIAVRAIIVSPFAEDGGQALYLGGYDADLYPAHNTAWLYRVGLNTALSRTGDKRSRGFSVR